MRALYANVMLVFPRWEPSLDGTILRCSSLEDLLLICLPQRYKFKTNLRSSMMVQASFLRLGHCLTPCIVDPPCLPLTIASIKTSEQIVPTPSTRTVTRRSDLITSKKRVRSDKSVTHPAAERPQWVAAPQHSMKSGNPPRVTTL